MNKPVIADHAKYQLLISDLNDYITQIETYQDALTDDHRVRLSRINKDVEDSVVFDSTAVDNQFALIKNIQEDLVSNGHLRDQFDNKELISMTSAIGSLITLFIKANKQVDEIRDAANLKESVLVAIKDLDEQTQIRFFDKLRELGG